MNIHIGLLGFTYYSVSLTPKTNEYLQKFQITRSSDRALDDYLPVRGWEEVPQAPVPVEVVPVPVVPWLIPPAA